MEKMIWEKPEMNEIAFAANEYVAACGDGGTNYIFECNANSDGWFTDGGTVYKETGTEGFQWFYEENADERMGSYSPCSEKHTTDNKGEFFDGWLVALKPSSDGLFEKIKVIIWTGLDNDNIHCTKNLDMNSWETAKS